MKGLSSRMTYDFAVFRSFIVWKSSCCVPLANGFSLDMNIRWSIDRLIDWLVGDWLPSVWLVDWLVDGLSLSLPGVFSVRRVLVSGNGLSLSLIIYLDFYQIRLYIAVEPHAFFRFTCDLDLFEWFLLFVFLVSGRKICVETTYISTGSFLGLKHWEPVYLRKSYIKKAIHDGLLTKW